MKRKDYRRPTMKVVMLQQQCHILDISKDVEQRTNYTVNSNNLFDEED